MSENMPKPSAFSLIYRADDTAILLDSIQGPHFRNFLRIFLKSSKDFPKLGEIRITKTSSYLILSEFSNAFFAVPKKFFFS